MSTIERPRYLQRLIAKQHNGRVKIITGIRRCGKSFLLSNLYRAHLLASGVRNDRIIDIALDRREFEDLRNPEKLYRYIMECTASPEMHYVFIDEVQLSYRVRRPDVDESMVPKEDRDLLYTTFYDVLNDLIARDNLDVYVTGSNSRMLSSDIVSNFRDRGSEIRMWPLSFAEYYDWSGLEKTDAWNRYVVYGGMPLAALEPDERERERYLKGLFNTVYRADIVERFDIENIEALDQLVKELASAVGSLTNPAKLANTLNTVAHVGISDKTVKRYLDALEDAFIFSKAERYDVKGKRYFDYPMKFYVTDVGLRNALLNFRQIEETHLMENIIFNELAMRGYSVDVGAVRVVETKDGKRTDTMREIDFVVNRGHERAYIQSAFRLDGDAKKRQEITPLLKSDDFFRKYVIVGGSQQPWTDERGITYMGVIPFLLQPELLQ